MKKKYLDQKKNVLGKHNVEPIVEINDNDLIRRKHTKIIKKNKDIGNNSSKTDTDLIDIFKNKKN
jgi:hypothetical protein